MLRSNNDKRNSSLNLVGLRSTATSPALKSLASALVLVCLAGCGQKGPLILPQDQNTELAQEKPQSQQEKTSKKSDPSQ